VIVLSVGAISLLYWLLRHGAAADVARLFYLVPPVTALMAFVLFGERLDAFALGGMVLIALGVALARRKQNRSSVRDAFARRPPGMPALPPERRH
jgi:drug/metabolite transporter (DMT)-like permease